MGLNYNPGVQSIVAQLIMEGGRQRVQQQNQMVQTVSDMITQHKAKADELKGYQAVYKALSSDPANGLDPDKMPEDVATLKASPLQAETNRNKQAQQKQMLGLAALMEQAGAAAGALPNTGPDAPDPVATLMKGRGPLATMTQTPTASPLKAALLKASQNPDLYLTDEGQSMVKEMVQKAVGQQKTTWGTDPNGNTVALDPNGRVQWQPKSLLPAAARAAAVRPDAKEPYNITLKDSDGKPYDVLFEPTTGKSERVRTAGGTGMETTQYRAAAQRLLARERAAHDELMSGQLTKSPNLANLQKSYDAAKSASDEFFNGDGGSGAKRVSVTGPNGEKGTVEEGDELPEGWKLE